MNVFKFPLIFLAFFALFLACESTGADAQAVGPEFHGFFDKSLEEKGDGERVDGSGNTITELVGYYTIVIDSTSIRFLHTHLGPITIKNEESYIISNPIRGESITDEAGTTTTELTITTNISGTPTFTIDFKEEDNGLRRLIFPDAPTKADIFPDTDTSTFPLLEGEYEQRPPQITGISP